MIYALSRFFCALICRPLFRIKVEGAENIPKRGGFILASNHVSFLDPIILGVACPRRLNYMARHDLFSNRLFVKLLSLWGAFPVKRNSADLYALKEAMRRIKAGGGMVLFPEGTRSNTGALSDRTQAGVGFLAAKLKCPVIPAFIRGTEKALPKGARRISLTKIRVGFGKEILIERGLPYQDISQIVMAGIKDLSC